MASENKKAPTKKTTTRTAGIKKKTAPKKATTKKATVAKKAATKKTATKKTVVAKKTAIKKVAAKKTVSTPQPAAISKPKARPRPDFEEKIEEEIIPIQRKSKNNKGPILSLFDF